MSEIPATPNTRKEAYLAAAAGQAVEYPAKPITREEAYLKAIAEKPSGGGGTTDYEQLEHKPQIGGVELSGNKTAAQLGLATEQALSGKQDALSAGDYIQFNGNEISVNRDIAKNSIRRYVFRGSESTRYIDTYFDDELVETVSMYFTESTRNFNDEISVGYDGTSKWLITNLKASTTKPQGYVEQRGFYDSSEYTQSFEIVLHAGDKLVIKDELDAAIAGKQNAFSVGDDLVLSNNTLGVQVSVPSVVDDYAFSVDESNFFYITKTHEGTQTTNSYPSGIYTTYNIDDLFTLTYDGNWTITLLVASTEYSAGTTWSSGYLQPPAISNLDFVVSYATGSASEFIGELQKANIYSTSEVNTGKKWIDGKDIYRKTFHFTEETEQTSKDYDISSLNADFVMLRDPVYKLGAVADNLVVSCDQYLNSSYNRSMTAIKSAITVRCDGWGFIEAWCNLYYTKSTT